MKQIANKTTLLRILFVLILSGAALWAQPQRDMRAGAPLPQMVADEVIVKYKSHVSQFAAEVQTQRIANSAVRVLQHTPDEQGPMVVAKIQPGQSIPEAVYMMSRSSDVEYAQPNYIYHATAVPNDTEYGKLWGLKNTGQSVSGATYSTNNPGTSGRDIDAQSAWDIITDCSSVTVAVIDSGVNYNNEDLTANMVNGSFTCPGGTGSRGCDFVGTGDNDPMDFNGHGTHVAGTIGAVGNNSTGIAGVCWGARILAVRVLDASGSGTTADIVEGVNFAAATGVGNGNAKVINMSLGGSTSDSAFNTALTTAQTNDVVVVVAAGNSTQNHNTTAGYPCDYTQSNILCVAAADQTYGIASFSDFDSNSTAASRKVDIAAPGVNIRSTYFGTTTTITDTFSSGWTYSGGGWTAGTCSSVSVLTDPGTWCSSTTPVGNSRDDRAYKVFNLSGYNAATLTTYLYIDLTHAGDIFKTGYKAAGGDPFAGGGAGNQFTGSTHGSGSITSDISTCNASTCTVGFQLVTDGTTNTSGDGIAVASFSINGQTVTTNAYAIENGTSMASPHVAGIATMLRARNPNYTYTDVINAIMNGGDAASAFASNTKSGKVADAMGSLKYIPTPATPSLSSP
ncbi:MAG: S8 family serine peptidase [Spirochaetia bacterium]|nr:S8 family serine peptidase [Spirochaetia bacterium]